MSLGELLTYASHRRIRIGITTNARRREATPGGRMISITASPTSATENGLYRLIPDPGGFPELELAADELLRDLRELEGRAAA